MQRGISHQQTQGGESLRQFLADVRRAIGTAIVDDEYFHEQPAIRPRQCGTSSGRFSASFHAGTITDKSIKRVPSNASSGWGVWGCLKPSRLPSRLGKYRHRDWNLNGLRLREPLASARATRAESRRIGTPGKCPRRATGPKSSVYLRSDVVNRLSISPSRVSWFRMFGGCGGRLDLSWHVWGSDFHITDPGLCAPHSAGPKPPSLEFLQFAENPRSTVCSTTRQVSVMFGTPPRCAVQASRFFRRRRRTEVCDGNFNLDCVWPSRRVCGEHAGQ